MADFDEKDLNENEEDKKEIRDVGQDKEGTSDKPENGSRKDNDYEDVCFICRRRARQGRCSSCPTISRYVMTVCIRQWIRSASLIIRGC